MGIKYEVLYHELVVKEDVPKLTKAWNEKVRSAIEIKLTVEPQTYGKPLRRSLKGYRRLRVGDYRVIYRIEEEKVKILLIEHRSIVYKKVDKRT